MVRTSAYWQYFVRMSPKTAKCNICRKIIKTSGNTSNLKCHISYAHKNLNISSVKKTTSSTPSPKKERNSVKVEENEIEIELNEERHTENENFELVDEFEEILLDVKELPPSPSVLRIEYQSPTLLVSETSQAQTQTVRRSDKITEAIMYMICKDMHPIDTVENPGFQHLIKCIAPHYTIPHTGTFELLIEDTFNTMKKLLKSKMKNKKCIIAISTCTDWVVGESFLVTARFHDTDDLMCTVNLGCILMEYKQSLECLAEQLIQLCEDWDIDIGNVMAIVTDNSSTIANAVAIAFGSHKHILCFANTLNLALLHAFENCIELKRIVSKVKSIVSWFYQCAQANDELNRKTNQQLVQSVPNQWITVLHMLQSFIKLRLHINEIMNNYSAAPSMLLLPPSELEYINEVCKILKPLEKANAEIISENYLMGSMAIPIVFMCRIHLEQLTLRTDASKHFRATIIDELNRRFGHLESCQVLAVATLLDPRFKHLYLRDRMLLSKHLKFIDYSMRNKEEKSYSMEKGGGSLFEYHNTTIQKRWRQMERKEDEINVVPLVEPYHSELRLYMSAPAEKIQINPLTFWSQMVKTYPVLSTIAMMYLTSVATSKPPEKILPSAARLSRKYASKFLFLKSAPDEFWSVCRDS